MVCIIFLSRSLTKHTDVLKGVGQIISIPGFLKAYRLKNSLKEKFHLLKTYFLLKMTLPNSISLFVFLASKLQLIKIKSMALTMLGGGGRIRTIEANRNRFTVCPLWPLGNSPIWSFMSESNQQPADYKSAALPLSQ